MLHGVASRGASAAAAAAATLFLPLVIHHFLSLSLSQSFLSFSLPFGRGADALPLRLSDVIVVSLSPASGVDYCALERRRRIDSALRRCRRLDGQSLSLLRVTERETRRRVETAFAVFPPFTD